MNHVRNEMEETTSSPLLQKTPRLRISSSGMSLFHMQTDVSDRKLCLVLHDGPFVAKYNTTTAYRSRRLLSVADKSSFWRGSKYAIHSKANTAAESSGSEVTLTFNASANISIQLSVGVGTTDGFRVGSGVGVGVDV